MLKLYTMILVCTLVYGQAVITEFKRLESVEMDRDGDIFEAEVAFTGPSSVEVAPGEDAALFCRVEIPYKFCNFISPRGVTYSLGPQDDYVHDGRISFANSEDPSRVCGIQVGQVEDTDNGEWRCKVIVVGGGMAREFSGRANITVVGGGVVRQFSGRANITEEERKLNADVEYMDEEGSMKEPFSAHESALDSNKFSFEGVKSLDGYATVSPAQAHSNIHVNVKKITKTLKSIDSTESSSASTYSSTAGLDFKSTSSSTSYFKSTSVFNPVSAFADITDPSTASTIYLLNTSEEGFSQVKDSNNLDNYKENDSGTSDTEDSNDNADDSYDDDYETDLFKTEFSEGHVVISVIVVIVVFVIIFITAVARSKGMLCFQNQHTEEDKFSLDFSAIEKGEFSKENEMGDFEYNEEESKISTLQL